MRLYALLSKAIFTPLNTFQMKPTNKLLGIFGMLAAPFLSFQMMCGQAADAYYTSLGGVFDLIYMCGWMCSVFGLKRLQMMGKSNNLLCNIQLVLLSVANVWNVWVIFDPNNNTTLFFVLDMFWPLSNLFMLVLGIVIAVKGTVKGWRRYVVLTVGLWLPFALATSMLFGRDKHFAYYPGAAYSILAWITLGWFIYISEQMYPAKRKLAFQ